MLIDIIYVFETGLYHLAVVLMCMITSKTEPPRFQEFVGPSGLHPGTARTWASRAFEVAPLG